MSPIREGTRFDGDLMDVCGLDEQDWGSCVLQLQSFESGRRWTIFQQAYSGFSSWQFHLDWPPQPCGLVSGAVEANPRCLLANRETLIEVERDDIK
jgi:hypothetical protein